MVQHLSVETLAAKCREETHKYYRQQAHDTRYCFELFRRAFQEKDSEAFKCLYQAYAGQVTRWVSSLCQDEVSRQYIGDFTQEVFTRLYQLLARDPQRLNDFDTLESLLKYMKVTSQNVVKQYYRKHNRATLTPLELEEFTDGGSDPHEEFHRMEVWTKVWHLLPMEKDRTLVRLVFIEGMKHPEIVKARPDLWDTTRRVVIDLYRVKGILRNNPDLKALADVE